MNQRRVISLHEVQKSLQRPVNPLYVAGLVGLDDELVAGVLTGFLEGIVSGLLDRKGGMGFACDSAESGAVALTVDLEASVPVWAE
jgi:hypothetical protein